jgi:transcriptional regulator with XRE-family HTH domain
MEGTPTKRYPNRIRQFRLEKGLTQRDLARILGYKSVSSLSHMECGRKLPSLQTALKLEQALQRLMGDIYPRLYKSIQNSVGQRREALFNERGQKSSW